MSIKPPNKCYMCEENRTSIEHVPPKCIFPKGFRQNLITVPSCEKHNLGKSQDDEYLKDILGSCLINGDDMHQNTINDSIDKAYIRNANFRKNIIENTIKVNGEKGFKVDMSRLENIFHHIFAGILFHHYEKQWLGECKFVFLFLNSSKSNSDICEDILSMFDEYTEYGENQEIFKYKITPIEQLPVFVIQMIFFDDIKIIGYNNPQTTNPKHKPNETNISP